MYIVHSNISEPRFCSQLSIMILSILLLAKENKERRKTDLVESVQLKGRIFWSRWSCLDIAILTLSFKCQFVLKQLGKTTETLATLCVYP